jgi:hypothetical protein
VYRLSCLRHEFAGATFFYFAATVKKLSKFKVGDLVVRKDSLGLPSDICMIIEVSQAIKHYRTEYKVLYFENYDTYWSNFDENLELVDP